MALGWEGCHQMPRRVCGRWVWEYGRAELWGAAQLPGVGRGLDSQISPRRQHGKSSRFSGREFRMDMPSSGALRLQVDRPGVGWLFRRESWDEMPI